MAKKLIDNSVLIKDAELELAKRQLQLSCPRIRSYFIIMLVVVLFNYMVDMFASSINNLVYSDALCSILNISSVNDPLYAEGSSQFDFFHAVISGLTLVVLPVYKSLSDRFGRKMFLWLNTLLTGVGLFIMLSARSVFVYSIGYVVISFFFNGDVHQLYLIEESPKEFRSTITAVVNALGTLAASLLGVARRVFVTSSTVINGWRNIVFVCVLFAVPVVLLSIFSLKDTTVFLKNRVEYLTNYLKELRGEDTVTNETKKSANSEKGGLIGAVKYIFKHKQTVMIFIVTSLFSMAMVFQKHYSTILNDCVESLSYSEVDVSNIAIIFPIVQSLFSVFSGFLSDRLGRRTNFIVNGLIAIPGFVLFVVGAYSSMNSIIASIFYGVAAGGYWSARNSLQLNIMSESTPTNTRASAVSILGVLATSSYAVFNLLLGRVAKLLSGVVSHNIAFTYTVGFAFISVAAVIVFIFGVKETKGVDLESI